MDLSRFEVQKHNISDIYIHIKNFEDHMLLRVYHTLCTLRLHVFSHYE